VVNYNLKIGMVYIKGLWKLMAFHVSHSEPLPLDLGGLLRDVLCDGLAPNDELLLAGAEN
jgi:hypothetical protein